MDKLVTQMRTNGSTVEHELAPEAMDKESAGFDRAS
jgi:hypothetical protein